MKTAKDPRHLIRLKIVQELFSQSFLKQPVKEEKTKRILAKKDLLDPTISTAAPEFPLDKIAKVDLAILRLATYELLLEKEQPPKVVIDEAVEIAKTLGGEGSPPFVNGVLGTILQNLKK